MNFTKYFFLVTIACMTMMACNKKNADQAKENTEQQDQNTSGEDSTEDPKDEKAYQVVLYQKTPCFGKCPVFEVKFFSDGKASWQGKMNVERMGNYEAKIDLETIKEIQRNADSIGYWDLYEQYPTENRVADLPSTITSIRVGDMVKTVRNTHDAPRELTKFENYILEIAEGLEWQVSNNK